VITKRAYEREQQKAQEARAERARAEANFRQAREAVNFFVQLSDEDFLDRPALLGVRVRLLETALAYFQEFINQHDDDPSIQAELEDSKDHAARILRDLAALQDCNRFELLTLPEVQEDLGLWDAQKAQVAARWTELAAPRHPAAGELRWLGPEQRRKELLAGNRRGEQATAEVLTPAQARRFRQITLQCLGLRAFHNPAVVAVLGLTPEQSHAIRQRFGRERAIKGNGLLHEVSPDTRMESVLTNVAEHRRRALEQALEVLTAEQRARWQEMVGKPCRMPLSAFFGRGHHSGFAQFYLRVDWGRLRGAAGPL
jgi:hypothetical protein